MLFCIDRSAAALLLASSLTIIGAPMAGAHDDEVTGGAPVAALDEAGQAVADTLQAYATAFAGGDLAQIAEFFVTDERLSVFEGSAADFGWESHRAHLAAEVPLFTETRYQITDIRPRVDGELAYATFGWLLDVTVVSDQFDGGQHPVSMRGVGTVVLIAEDGRWKIQHLHTAREPSSPQVSHETD